MQWKASVFIWLTVKQSTAQKPDLLPNNTSPFANFSSQAQIRSYRRKNPRIGGDKSDTRIGEVQVARVDSRWLYQ